MANPHPVQKIQTEQAPYHQKDAVRSAIYAGSLSAGAGLFISAAQNSLAKTNVGAMGVFTRTGSTVASFTAITTIYAFTKNATANLREKDDPWNAALGAFLGGASLGLKTGRMPMILGTGAAMSVIMTAYDFTGGSLRGKRTEHPEMDEYERKEYLRNNRRRPIEETLSEIGEGRGIKPAGYEERRRQRLKEKYGVDIEPVSVATGEE